MASAYDREKCKDTPGRTGVLKTPHGEVAPVFMPVGTQPR